MIPAQFLDFFGWAGFIVLFYLGIKIVQEKKFKYHGYTILLISLIGFIADSYSLITNYLLK